MRKLVALFVVMAFLAVPAMAGEHKKCTASPDECLKKMQQKLAEKPWLGIEYDAMDDGRWVVKEVYAGSPAEAAGFKPGDRILSMQGVRYAKDNKKALKKAYEGVQPGSTVEYVVERAGSKVKLEATMGNVPVEIQKKWIAKHMATYHPDTKMAKK